MAITLGSSAADYKKALIDLSPSGNCWPTSDDSNWVKLLDALAQEFARVDGRAVDLYNEGFPDTSDELLANWERIVGLPDQFSDPDASLDERRAAVLFKLRARGGQTVEYYEGLLETLGYRVQIIDATPFRAGISHADDFLFDATWVNIFLVIVENPVSDPDNLEARITSLKPAHSKSVFLYVDDIDEY